MFTRIFFELYAIIAFLIGPFFSVSLAKQIWGKGNKVMYVLAFVCGTTYFCSIEFAVAVLIRTEKGWHILYVLSSMITIISYWLFRKCANTDGKGD